MSVSKEDYLRIMYEMYEADCDEYSIKSVEISKKFGVSKSSVSQMLKKLKDDNSVLVKPYSEIKFTKEGLIRAKRITKNYRLIEIFLKDILKLDLKQIYSEAHKLEHAFSDEGINKLDLFLDRPNKSIDGKKIPR